MAKPRTWLGTQDPYARLRKIETLDPEKDSREICRLFYRDFLSLMLLPTFGGYMFANSAPRQSRILSATGELERRVFKRFVDGAVLAGAVLDHGVEKPGPGRDAARRINEMHRSYDIHPDDFVAFGISQVLLTIESAERLGWRPVTDIEREALRVHYTEETRIFGGRQPLPPSLAAMRAFWERYLNEQLAFEPQNLRLAMVMIGFVKSLFPAPLRPFLAPLLLVQLDPRIVRACGLRFPGLLARKLSDALFRFAGKRDPLPDDSPDVFQELIAKAYPNGYKLQSLGTKHDVQGTPRSVEHAAAAPAVSAADIPRAS